MNLRETGFKDVDLIQLDPGRVQWWGFSEHGNETSGSIKHREFLYQLSDSHLLKEDSAPWN